MLCDKVNAADDSSATGVEVQLEWGISDLMDNGKRKTKTRFLYIQAQTDCRKFTQNWQPEVQKLMGQIKSEIIEHLIVDDPQKDDLDRLRNATNQWVKKVPLAEALERARTRHASAEGMSAAGPTAASARCIYHCTRRRIDCGAEVCLVGPRAWAMRMRRIPKGLGT